MFELELQIVIEISLQNNGTMTATSATYIAVALMQKLQKNMSGTAKSIDLLMAI